MSILTPTNLETCDYGTINWNSIYSTNFQRLNDYLNVIWSVINDSKNEGDFVAIKYDGKVFLLKNNFNATSNPTSSNDRTQGYGVGSIWRNGNDVFMCVNSSVGSAVWLKLSGLSSIEEDTSPKLGGELNAQNHSIGFTLQNISSSSGVATVDWKNGNIAKLTLTENTTLSFTNPSYVCSLTLMIVQDATGGHSITFPTIKWANGEAPTLNISPNNVSIIRLFFDGSDYYGMYADSFA